MNIIILASYVLYHYHYIVFSAAGYDVSRAPYVFFDWTFE